MRTQNEPRKTLHGKNRYTAPKAPKGRDTEPRSKDRRQSEWYKEDKRRPRAEQPQGGKGGQDASGPGVSYRRKGSGPSYGRKETYGKRGDFKGRDNFHERDPLERRETSTHRTAQREPSEEKVLSERGAAGAHKPLDYTKKQDWKPGNMIYPVPAVMVSCKRPGERPDIATVAWTGNVSTAPPMVYISLRPSRYSHDIIKETGEFVINLTTKELVRAADYSGVKSGRETDKFEVLHLKPCPCAGVDAPGIAQSPVCIACKVTQILPLGSHDMFLAEVVGVSVAQALLDKDGAFDLGAADLAAYVHGSYMGLGEILGSFGYSVRRKPAAAKSKTAHKKKSR